MADDQQFTNIRPITPPKTSGQFTNIRPLKSSTVSDDPLVTGKGMMESAQKKPAPGRLPGDTSADFQFRYGGNPGSFEGHPENIGEYIPATVGQMGSGVASVAHGDVAKGLHQVASGVGNAMLPAAPFFAAAAPLGFAGAAAGGAAGGYGAKKGAELLGATPDQADLAGDVGGLLGGFAGAKGASALRGIPELIKINSTLGVKPKNLRVGSAGTLEEFAQNPARAVQKAGLSARDLGKMNPLERYQKITELRESAGQSLDAALKKSNAPVDIQHAVQDTFDNIADPKMKKQAANQFNLILKKSGITSPPQMSNLTPMQARTIQRGLDDFANFAPQGQRESFAQVATRLRQQISRATVKAVPEVKQLDQDYTDLVGASDATKAQAARYATTAPPSKLRKTAISAAKIAGAGALAGAGFEGAKHLVPN